MKKKKVYKDKTYLTDRERVLTRFIIDSFIRGEINIESLRRARMLGEIIYPEKIEDGVLEINGWMPTKEKEVKEVSMDIVI